MRFECHLCNQKGRLVSYLNLYDLLEHLWYRHRLKDREDYKRTEELLRQAHHRGL